MRRTIAYGGATTAPRTFPFSPQNPRRNVTVIGSRVLHITVPSCVSGDRILEGRNVR